MVLFFKTVVNFATFWLHMYRRSLLFLPFRFIAHLLKGDYAVDACNLACVGIGLDEFINLLIYEDIDPIWYAIIPSCLYLIYVAYTLLTSVRYCQILDLCAVDDCQGITIIRLLNLLFLMF